MAEGARVLVLEDDAALGEILCDELEDAGHAPCPVANLAHAREQLAKREFDVALLDLILPDGEGTEILRKASEEGLAMECIILTGYAEISTAIEAMKLGAYDYVTKPAHFEELDVVVRRAAEKARLRRENAALRVRVQRMEPRHGLLTEDPVMQKLLDSIDRVALLDLPILIQGESGTGKERIARAVHVASARAARAFVALDCAATRQSAIECGLFGHERGGFTVASGREPGLFEAARGGTLFLDEVGRLNPAAQVALLTVLESGEYHPISGAGVLQANTRIVSATTEDLEAAVEQGRFREDLFIRLSAVLLRPPPLRDRSLDIALLAARLVDETGPGKMLSPGAVAALERYTWPGNVRELQIVIRRATLLTIDEEIQPEDLSLPQPQSRPEIRADLTLAAFELQYVAAVLDGHDGDCEKAARTLGIDADTLRGKLSAGQQRRRHGRNAEN